MRRAILLGVMLGVAASCGEPSVDRPDGGPLFEIDAGFVVPNVPRWARVDTLTPYEIVTLRGTSDAKRVVIFGAPQGPLAQTVLPDGTFCSDVRLPGPGTYVFEMVGLGTSGIASDKSETIQVVYDVNAAPINDATTCDGSHPAGCINAVEICGNMRDDDCNNLIDEDDPTCATCTDDALEPNDDPTAPQVDPGRLEGLMLCPADVDYYGVFAQSGETITARVFFEHAEGNLDVVLYGLDHATVVEQSLTQTNDEMLTFTATASGVYPLSVFAEGGVSNSYVLELDVR
jgi:hypothetical protein